LTAGADSSNAASRTQAARPALDRKEQKRAEAAQRQARSNEKKTAQKRVRDLETQIHDLEVKQADLAAELEKPENYSGGRAMQINRELMEVVDQLAEKTAEWEAAATKLAELETPEDTVKVE
jgi:ATP-binding cassette subfamily F protein 3